MLADLFASGRIFDVVLAVLAIEAIVLIYRDGRGAFPWLVHLLAAAGLVAAARAAVAGAPWWGVAAALGVALGAHVAELARKMSMDRTRRCIGQGVVKGEVL